MERAGKPPSSRHDHVPAAEYVSHSPAVVSFADNRSAAIVQHKLADTIARSPKATAQRELFAGIHASPNMTAQREQIRSAHGVTAQLAGGSAKETLLQGKAASGQPESRLAAGLPQRVTAPAQQRGRGEDALLQGRVKATAQLRAGVPVTDDQGLEHEADVMGAAALHAAATGEAGNALPGFGRLPAGVMSSPRIATPVVQGDFPDAYNDPRKETQKSGQGSSILTRATVKLDHMVSQKNLRAFASVYKTLDSLSSNPRSKWEKTQEAMVALRKATPQPTADQNFFSEGHLVNMPNNIVPGLDNETQGAGDNFDPQVQATVSGQNTTRVEQTALSRSQFAMDSAIRILNQWVGSAADILPKGSAATQGKHYNSGLDTAIAAQIDIITDAMTKMGAVDEPIHSPAMWYSHSGGNVKKRSADWIEDESQVAIGGAVAPVRAAWNHQFTFTVTTISNEKGGIEQLPVNVNVAVQVPAATWAHIYDRHYLSTFGGTIEAVNTFWKAEPYTYLTNQPGTTLLESELRLILERSFSFYKTFANVDLGDKENDSWSKGADKFFFQGNAEAEVADKDDTDGIEYDVKVLLKSIAPQDPAHALALRPDQL